MHSILLLFFERILGKIFILTSFCVYQLQQKIMSRGDVTAEDEIADSVFVQVSYVICLSNISECSFLLRYIPFCYLAYVFVCVGESKCLQ